MKPLPVILGLAVALASGSSVTLHLHHQRVREDLARNLSRTQEELALAQKGLVDAADRAELLAGRTAALETELADAKSRLDAADQRSAGLARELEVSRETVVTQETAARRLQEENAALTAELVQTRLNPLTNQEGELAQARQAIATLEAKLVHLEATARETAARPAPPAEVRVLGVGAENAFVVLDFGARDGAAVNQMLLVRRGSAPLATVAIRAVHPRHAIAHVLPDSLQGSLQNGDAAILLN